MKTFYSLLGLAGLAFWGISLTGCSTIAGSGVTVERLFDRSNFNQVAVGSAITYTISRGPDYQVTITADSQVIDFVRVNSEGQTLRVDLEPGVNTTSQIRAKIVLPDLQCANISGASKGTVRGFSPAVFSLQASGASQVDLAAMSVGIASFVVSGASSCRGNEVGSPYAAVYLSGASTLSLTGAIGIDGNLTGASTLMVKSCFNVCPKVSGGSSITRY